MKTLNLPQAVGKALAATAITLLLVTQASAQSVHSGNAALKLNTARANYHTFTNLTQGTTYILSYWVKGLDAGTKIGVTLADDVAGVYPPQLTNQSSAITSGGYQTYTTADDQWYQYFATIVPTATSDLLTIGIDVRPSPAYIDDVVLRQAGSITNLVYDAGFETAYQTNYNGDGNGWPTANWIDLRWYSEYAWDTHQYGNPGGPKALEIEGSPTNAPYAPLPDESWPATTVVSADRALQFYNIVTVRFSVTGLQAASATNTAHYSLNNGNSVTSASLDSTFAILTLTLANNIDLSLTHTLTINGLLGMDGTAIATNAPGSNTVVNIVVPITLLTGPDVERIQDSGPDHLLSLEAAHYNNNDSPSGGKSWLLYTNNPPTLVGTETDVTPSTTGVMYADPNTGVNKGTVALGATPANTPRLDYRVKFVTNGVHTVWLRGVGDSSPGAGANDSVFIGLDGALTTRFTGFTGGAGYYWGQTPVGDSPLTITVPSEGSHIINIWMREDGFVFDKLVLSTNPSLNPTGVGPVESPSLPHLTGVRSGANLVLTWPGGNILQASANAAGTYVDILASSSPWPVSLTNTQTYYRVKP